MARIVNAASKGGGKILMYSNQPSAFQYELSLIALPPDVPYSSVSQPPGRGPVRGPGINCTGQLEVCHFSFLSNFHEQMFQIGNILKRKIFLEYYEKLRARCWPEETTICYETSLVQ